MSKIAKMAGEIDRPESSIMREARLSSDHAKAALEDGAPEFLVRAPETPEQADARRKRSKRMTGPERKLKDPSKCKGDGASLGAPVAFMKRAGAEPKKEPTTMNAKAKKPAAAPKHKREPKAKTGESKVSIISALLQSKAGTTTAEVLAKTGWPAVSMPQQAKAAGLKLRKEKTKGEPTRYFGTPA